jgi:hypothetical protein
VLETERGTVNRGFVLKIVKKKIGATYLKFEWARMWRDQI